MAAGDITFYNKFKLGQLGGGTISNLPVDWDTDLIKVVVLTPTHTPDLGDATAQEHFDDISANEVATATSYTGPITLASVTLALSSGTVTMDAADIVISQDAGGFTNGRWIVCYHDSGTPATSPLIWSGDLGADKSLVPGDLTFQWSATGIATLA